MISEIRQRFYEGIFGNYQMNYLTEFELYIDIGLIVYIFCAKFFFFKKLVKS